jgi:2,4-dienoyl-CoA reductase (NADPH2)
MLREACVPFETAGGAGGTEGLNAVRATAEGLRAAHRIAARASKRGPDDASGARGPFEAAV